MTKKQFVNMILIMFGLFFLGIGFFIAGAILQDIDGGSVFLGILIFLGFASLIGDIVFSLKNYKNLIQYEIEQKINKNEHLETRRLLHVKLNLSEKCFASLIEKRKHGKAAPGLFWIFQPNYWARHLTYIVAFKYNEDMKVTEEYNEESDEDASGFTHKELQELEHQLPKASNDGFYAKIIINVLDSVDDTKIAQAERIVTNAEIFSRSLGIFAPIILYYLYDTNTKTLYYEPYKRYRMYPRPNALKKFNIMLGIPNETK
jgi:hypothetical protein